MNLLNINNEMNSFEHGIVQQQYWSYDMTAQKRRRSRASKLNFSEVYDIYSFMNVLRLNKYTPGLVSSGVDLHLLLHLADKEMEMAGIFAQGARTRLLAAVEKFKRTSSCPLQYLTPPNKFDSSKCKKPLSSFSSSSSNNSKRIILDLEEQRLQDSLEDLIVTEGEKILSLLSNERDEYFVDHHANNDMFVIATSNHAYMNLSFPHSFPLKVERGTLGDFLASQLSNWMLKSFNQGFAMS